MQATQAVLAATSATHKDTTAGHRGTVSVVSAELSRTCNCLSSLLSSRGLFVPHNMHSLQHLGAETVFSVPITGQELPGAGPWRQPGPRTAAAVCPARGGHPAAQRGTRASLCWGSAVAMQGQG